MTSQKTHVSETKIKIVEELIDLIKNQKTILIASIKSIPASQFQEIAKKLRKKAIIKVPKKNLIFKAIDSSGNEAIKMLREQIKESVAILFSDLDCFELASELIENKSPAKAKAGQEAPENIEIQEGPTDLVPGPAISELSALGIQIQIEKGKIHIKKPKVIVKKGEKISSDAAAIMNKLDIKPFSIGFIPLSAFNIQENKLYVDIKIDKERTLNELKTAFGKALAFAVDIGYTCKDTITFLISKAGMHGKALGKFGEKEEVKEEEKEIAEEENKEDIKEETQEQPKTEDENVQPENKNQEEEK